jgi:hypothetical protein
MTMEGIWKNEQAILAASPIGLRPLAPPPKSLLEKKLTQLIEQSLHSAFCILHSAFYILHFALFILHSSFCTLHSSFFTLHLYSPSASRFLRLKVHWTFIFSHSFEKSLMPSPSASRFLRSLLLVRYAIPSSKSPYKILHSALFIFHSAFILPIRFAVPSLIASRPLCDSFK